MSRKIKFAIHRVWLIFSLLFCTIGCDQVTKLVVRDSIPITGTLSYLNGSIQIAYARNSGAFMSLGENLPSAVRFWFFNVICGISLGAVALVLFRAKQIRPLPILGLTLVLGGGIGNLIDRLAFGSVTDFLFIHYGSLRTGIFNIADMAIVLGAFLLILPSLTSRKARGF